MKKHTPLALLALIVLCALNVFSQTQFQTAIDLGASENASDIKQTSDGGYIVSGLQFVPATSTQLAFLLKLDADGAVQWNKTYSGGYTNGSDLFHNYRVIEASEGGYLMLGTTSSFGVGNPKVFLIRTDAFGDTLWTRTYGGTAGNDGNSIFQSEDGGFVIGGSFSFGGQRRMGILKLKSDGSLRYESYFADGLACPFFECVRLSNNRYGIIYTYSTMLLLVDSVGGYIANIPLGFGSGFSVGAIEEPNGDFTTLSSVSGLMGGAFGLVRTNVAGTASLQKKYSTGNDDAPRELIRAANGNYILFGLSTSMNGPSYLTAMEVDASGAVVWSNQYSVSNGAYHEAGTIIPTADGGYAMVGQYDRSGQYSDFDVYVVKTDAQGQSGCNQVSISPTVAMANPIAPSSVSTYVGSLTNTGQPVPTIIGSAGSVNPNVLCLSSTNVQDNINAAWSEVYPNPVEDQLHVRFEDGRTATLFVTDLVGRQILDAQITGAGVLDVSGLPAGTYLLFQKNDAGSSLVNRFAKTQ